MQQRTLGAERVSAGVATSVRLGWAVVHLTWATAFVLAVSIGAERRFCTSFDRPMIGAGPFGGDQAFTSGKAGWVWWLLFAGFVGTICLTLLALAVVRTRRLATVAHVLTWVAGALATFVVVAIQDDDGAFCSVGSKAIATIVVTALLSVAVVALVSDRRANQSA